MTVFKTVFKIVNQNKFTILLYTIILIVFGGINFNTNDVQDSFIATKPDILVINENEENALSSALVDYLSQNANLKDIEDDEYSVNDALFYRDVNYIVYIPAHFGEDIMDGKTPEIEIKQTNDYPATLAHNLLNKYLHLAYVYRQMSSSEEDLINQINETLSSETKVEITTKLDTTSLSQATNYFNFLNYSLLAGCVYTICIILVTFKAPKIHKRNMISSKKDYQINFELLLSTSLIALILWLFYILLSLILLGKTLLTLHGLLYIINSFIFSSCALALSLLIGNIVADKNAINGIINVVALGSSFLCGSFVPLEYLPDKVITIAHCLPSYWFIKSNELIKTMETINMTTLKPYLFNLSIIIVFTVVFIILTNIISHYKRTLSD